MYSFVRFVLCWFFCFCVLSGQTISLGNDVYNSFRNPSSGFPFSGLELLLTVVSQEQNPLATMATVPQNLLQFSIEAEGWDNVRTIVTVDAIAAPDGSLTADRLVDDTENSSHYMLQNFAYIAGAQYEAVFSIKTGGREGQIRARDGTADVFLSYIDPDAGTCGTSESGTCAVADLGDGWYEYTIRGVALNSGVGWIYYANTNGEDTIYAGDDSTGNYVVDLQLCLGSCASLEIVADRQLISDYSGSGNTGCLGADCDVATDDPVLAVLAKSPSGYSIQGWEFATDDLIQVDSLATLFAGEDKPITVIAVVRRDAIATEEETVFSLGSSSTADPYFLFGVDSNNKWSWSLSDDALSTAVVVSTAGAEVDVWEVIACSSTGTAVTCYLNGDLLAGMTGATDVGTLTVDQASLGALRRITTTSFFNGFLTHPAIYPRALSASEVGRASRDLALKLSAWGICLEVSGDYYGSCIS